MERDENYLDSQNNTLFFGVSGFWGRKKIALQYISTNHITKFTLGGMIRGDFLHAACLAGRKASAARGAWGKNKEMFPPLPCSLYQKEEQARNYIKIERANNWPKLVSILPIILTGQESHFTAPSSPFFWILMLLNRMEKFSLKVGWKHTR